MQIQKNSAYIDFYVDKVKYEAYKTDRGRTNYLRGVLKKIADSLKLVKIQGVEIREVEFSTPTKVTVINDLGYWERNKVELNIEKLTFRNFGVDIISVVTDEDRDIFLNVRRPNFIITSAMTKII